MNVKSVIRVMFFGGIGALIIGFITGHWLQGMTFCLVLASNGEYYNRKRKRSNMQK